MDVNESKKGNGGRIKYRDAKLDCSDGRMINDKPLYNTFVRGIPKIFHLEKCCQTGCTSHSHNDPSSSIDPEENGGAGKDHEMFVESSGDASKIKKESTYESEE